MTRRIFCKVLLVAVAVFGLLALSSILLAQGRSEEALEHAKAVQERHTDRLMAMDGVEGTAIGYNQNDRLAVKVFTDGPGVRGIPKELDGVPVQVVVTGKFYALPRPPSPPGQDKKNPPPAAPTGLTVTDVGDTWIDLDWDDHPNPDSDLSHYNVYRSTTSGSYGGPITSVTISSHSDTGLATGTTYYYVVTAVDTGGKESENSGEASATTLGEPEPPPEEPLDPTSRWPRPVPIGISTGHPNITAGTIGCRVKAGSSVFALSNNHVYADENNATVGDAVIQPGSIDGGSSPADDIGNLSDFVEIKFDGSDNTIDAAIASSTTSLVGNATPLEDGYGIPSSTPVEATLGLPVQKYGRTTELTHGRVDGINATVRVRYDSGIARFVSQIIIRPGGFSRGGDSGSLIVTDDSACNPVGLLFAGGQGTTVANPIDAVLGAFSVSVDGK